MFHYSLRENDFHKNSNLLQSFYRISNLFVCFFSPIHRKPVLSFSVPSGVQILCSKSVQLLHLLCIFHEKCKLCVVNPVIYYTKFAHKKKIRYLSVSDLQFVSVTRDSLHRHHQPEDSLPAGDPRVPAELQSELQ